jgi:hypothetical protein
VEFDEYIRFKQVEPDVQQKLNWPNTFMAITLQNFQDKISRYKTTRGLLAKSLIIPFVLILSSCGSNADLAKVREFSQLSNSAKEALPKIANDVYLSCLRSARYRAVSTLPPTTQQTNVYDPQNDRLEDRTDAQKECDTTARKLGPKMKQGNAIVAVYIQKLGELASDNLTNVDPEFDQLKQSSGDLGAALGKQGLALQPEQITAGLDLFKFLVEGILNGKRVDTLSEVIPALDQPLQLYSDGLKVVVDRVYIGTYLRIEEADLDKYYKHYIREILASKARTQGDSTLALTDTLLSLDDKWNTQKDEIQTRRDLAFSYINLLGAITASHHELAQIYGGGETPSAQKVNKMLEKNTKALKDFVDKAEKLP